MSTRYTLAFSNVAAALLIVGGLSGCDSSTDEGPNGTTQITVNGKVTDDSGFAKALGSVEGAVVAASEVTASGSLRTLSGEATTDASGSYRLAVETTSSPLILSASKVGFNSRAIVEHRLTGSGIVNAMPMNDETTAEADVYVEAKSSASASLVSVADVAFYVDSAVAAAVRAGDASTAEIAVAIAAGQESEREYSDADPEGPQDEEPRRRADDRQRDSFITLQSALNAAAGSSAQTGARTTFEKAFVDAYAASGVDASVQAKAMQSGNSAMLMVAADANMTAETRLALRKRAEAGVALAASVAVQAAFEANGAAQATIDALAAAGESLYQSTATAQSQTQISVAFGTFAATVEAELATQLGVDVLVISSARAALDAAKVALQTSIDAAADAAAVASAYATFFAAAESSVAGSLSASGNAQLGAEVLSVIALF